MTSVSPALVSFRNVTKSYGMLKAVKDFTLDIDTGKFVTLLGPSGCGKSTTLRLLGGFERPDSGQILLQGRDITMLPPNRRNINTVFQDYALFPHMSIAQNIAFGLEMKGLDSQTIVKQVAHLLKMVELQDYAARLPAELSGGQKQRVALVRALAPDPQLLLLDEPLSALDAKLRRQMQTELKIIQKNTGKSFIFVTHDQEEALTMSDEIILMNQGKIEQKGKPEDIYYYPQTEFAANFIGEINKLECRIKAIEAGRAVLDWNGIILHSQILAKDESRTDFYEGQAVLLLIRPEILQYSPENGYTDKQTPNNVPVTVEQRIFKGSHETLCLRCDCGDRLHMMAASEMIPVKEGDRMKVCWSIARTIMIKR